MVLPRGGSGPASSGCKFGYLLWKVTTTAPWLLPSPLTVLNSDLVNDWEPPLSEMEISRQTSRLGDLVKLEVAWSCKESERAIRNYASGSKVAWKRLEETEIFHFGVGTLVPDSIILISCSNLPKAVSEKK